MVGTSITQPIQLADDQSAQIESALQPIDRPSAARVGYLVTGSNMVVVYRTPARESAAALLSGMTVDMVVTKEEAFRDARWKSGVIQIGQTNFDASMPYGLSPREVERYLKRGGYMPRPRSSLLKLLQDIGEENVAIVKPSCFSHERVLICSERQIARTWDITSEQPGGTWYIVPKGNLDELPFIKPLMLPSLDGIELEDVPALGVDLRQHAQTVRTAGKKIVVVVTTPTQAFACLGAASATYAHATFDPANQYYVAPRDMVEQLLTEEQKSYLILADAISQTVDEVYGRIH